MRKFLLNYLALSSLLILGDIAIHTIDIGRIIGYHITGLIIATIIYYGTKKK